MATATIVITEVYPPSAGKKQGTVKTDNGHLYGFFPDKIEPQVGTAEVTIESREYRGQTYRSITAYKMVGPPPGVKPAAGGSGSFAPWWMAFVSNTVAHAIQVGRIETPEQVGAWALAAKLTAIALEADTGEAEKLADDIPF